MSTSEERSPSVEKQNIEWWVVNYAITAIRNAVLDSKRQFRYIHGIPRGGLIPAVMLSHKLRIPLIMDTNILHIIEEPTIIVEDIVDTGETLRRLGNWQNRNHFVVALFTKEWAKPQPDFAAYITSDWIVFPWEA